MVRSAGDLNETPRERLFMAVALDDESRHALAARVSAMAPDGLPGRPVPVPNWHVTLRFVGRATPQERDVMLGFLDERLDVAPFRIRFEGLGGFPRASSAAVLWVAIADETDGLAALASVCEEAALTAGFAAEDRSFHAHLTLSRIRPPQPVEGLVAAAPSAGVAMGVGAVTLYRSKLGGGPARYEIVDDIHLRN